MAQYYTTSPNMGLLVPIVGQELGPTWAQDLNTNFQNILDQHDHSTGHGVPITPAGLNISSDLSMNGNNLTFLRAGKFQNQTSSLLSDFLAIYAYNGDLYYNNNSGNQVRITNGASIAGAGGTIGGLASPATATYVPSASSFVWQSNTNVAATMDSGPLIIRNTTASSYGVTLQAQILSSNYNLTLPTLPSVQSFMTLDASGNMSAPWTVDNNTIKIVSNQLVAQPSALVTVDNVTIQQSGVQLSVKNGDREHNWELNGTYPKLSFPLNNIDAIFFAPYNITITSVWIYSGTAGASGTTEFDLKVASSGGSFSSILSTTGKITSAAASGVWTDSGSIIGAQTGVTKPILSTTAISAGQAIRWDLLQSMANPATDARIRIFYKQA